MTGVTIKSVALEMQVSVDFLIKEFACVGIVKSEEDYVTLKEKKIILNKINCLKKNSENQLVLQRKTRSTLNISCIGGKNKKVCVEVRKNCTYIKSTLNYSNMGNLEKKGKNLLEFSLLPSLNKSLNDLVQNNLSEKKRIKIDNYKMLSTELFNDSICHNKALEEKKCISSGESHKFNKSKVINVVEKNKNLNIKSNFLGSICERKGNKNSIRMKSADNERRSRVRLKFRNEKFSRQKKNYNRQLYDMSTNIDKEEFSKFPRFDRNKRKSSVLVQNFNRPTQISARDVILGKTITVAELSNKMSIKSSQVIKVMMNLGFIATINQILDQDTAQLVAEEMGKNVILRKDNEIEKQIMRDRDVGDQLQAKIRAPIVTVMGHVDHGKTSLLDYIRSTTIVSSEHGGITQKIGAYHVKTDRGMITFIDTPGHEAFISMRDRGIQITDIVVLVVAADDGVMCQTVESIKKIQSAKIPLIVAINKIDKVGADPERVKHELSKYGVISDSWGGEVQFVEVSATVGTGINNLLDAILLQSEFLELKTVHDGMANATVIESFLDKRRGPIITALVHSGTLKCGDIVLCGKEYGRIRAMRDEFGRKIISAGPSIPTEILGLSGMPISGEAVIVVRNERKAREVAMHRKNKFRENKLFNKNKISVENAFSKVKFSILELNLIIKSDSQGSSEAIFESLKKLSVDQIKINILHNSVGFINETDILLAIASNAIILGFNVRTDISTRRLIELECVNIIHYYSIIYDLLNGVKKIIDSLVTPKYEKKIVGLAKVCNVFSLPKYGKVAGCIVTEGSIKRKNKICILREKKIVYEGELESLRRFKDDVNEVQYGIEFGITVKNYNNILLEDIIESFDILGV